MKDCGFSEGNHWFRYRTGGILIHDNKMLFVKSSIGNYYYMIGGGVHLGETSKSSIEREVYEEAGIRAKVEHLAVVCENFFNGKGGIIDGLDCHTIEFYYRMKLSEDDYKQCRKMTDSNEELVWMPVEQIESSDMIFKPYFVKECIKEILMSNSTLHFIEERDR